MAAALAQGKSATVEEVAKAESVGCVKSSSSCRCFDSDGKVVPVEAAYCEAETGHLGPVTFANEVAVSRLDDRVPVLVGLAHEKTRRYRAFSATVFMLASACLG